MTTEEIAAEIAAERDMLKTRIDRQRASLAQCLAEIRRLKAALVEACDLALMSGRTLTEHERIAELRKIAEGA